MRTIIIALWVGLAVAAAPSAQQKIDNVIATQAITPGDYMNPAFTGTVDIHVHTPTTVNASTGLLVVCHGLGGNYNDYNTECATWTDAYNVYTVQVNFRHSGLPSNADFGKYQAIDVLRATQYMFDNYPINQQRVFLWGASAGGLVALNAAKMAPRAFAFVAALSPITRPTNQLDRTTNGYSADPPNGWEGQILVAPNTYTTDEFDIRDAQWSAAHLKPTTVFLFHGSNDPTVDIQHSIDMHAALLQASVPVTFTTIVGGDHNFNGVTVLPDENTRFLVTQKYLTTAFNTMTRSGPTNLTEQAKVTFATRGSLAWPVKFDHQGLGTMGSIAKPGSVVTLNLGQTAVQVGNSLPLSFKIANWSGGLLTDSYLMAALVHLQTGTVYTLLPPTLFNLPSTGLGGGVSIPMLPGLPTGDFLFVAVTFGPSPSPYVDLDYAQFTLNP